LVGCDTESNTTALFVKVVVSDSDIFISAVESQIRDTDMAKFMVEYARDNILQNAAQAMLAQANQNSQGILSLLQ